MNKKQSTIKIGVKKKVSPRQVSFWLKNYNIKTRSTGEHAKFSHPNLTKEWLQKEYIINDRTAESIGNELGTSITTINRALKSLGLFTKVHPNSKTIYHKIPKEKLEKYYLVDRLSATEISYKYKCSHKTIINALKYYSIKVRDENEHRIIIRPELEHENLKELYENQKIDGKEIARLLGVSKSTIYKRIDKYNLLKHEILNENEIIELYVDKKKSIKRLSCIYNTSTDRIRGILIKHNIRIRSQYEYPNLISAPHEFILIPLLEKYNIRHQTSYILPSLPEQKSNRYEIDELLPDHNIFLELNGDYWHGKEETSIRDTRKYRLVLKYYPHMKFVIIWESQLKTGEAEKIIKSIL